MRRIDTLIIGGGQAGLATSRCLADRGIEHVVLERGRVGERWRSERWDSLRLLTPNWQSRLPGFRYTGPDPDGFMSRSEVIEYLERYAVSFAAPVESETTVRSVERAGDGFRVDTDRGRWQASRVVIATGHCDRPCVPRFADDLPGDVTQVVPPRYRRPQSLPAGGVLVVGASATGLQLADEIRRAGRDVTLSVGRHTRLPRRYRGRDIMEWLDAAGILTETADAVHDLEASRRQPSLQLVGRPDHASLDLGMLQDRGVRLAGRAVGFDGGRVRFEDDLEASVATADTKLRQLLARIDALVVDRGLAPTTPAPGPIASIRPAAAPTSLDLRAAGISTVLWATGYRRSYPWLAVPVLDDRGEIVHRGGVTPEDGLYVVGLQFLRRRNSSFIDGVGADAADIAERIATRRGTPRRAVA